MKAVRVVVFAKAPMAGAAKTRLATVLGEDGAARLAERMLLETLGAALDAAVGPVELCMEPAPEAPAWRNVAIAASVERSDQGSGDLGARLARAAKRTIETGEAVILIGTDCVEMSADLLREAAEQLEATGTVIYPASDGGYVLLGLTRFAPELFAAMPWSTAGVAQETVRWIASLGWPLHVGPTCHDVDVPDDLVRVPSQWWTSTG